MPLRAVTGLNVKCDVCIIHVGTSGGLHQHALPQSICFAYLRDCMKVFRNLLWNKSPYRCMMLGCSSVCNVSFTRRHMRPHFLVMVLVLNGFRFQSQCCVSLRTCCLLTVPWMWCSLFWLTLLSAEGPEFLYANIYFRRGCCVCATIRRQGILYGRN
jgi:hypothetical protein